MVTIPTVIINNYGIIFNVQILPVCSLYNLIISQHYMMQKIEGQKLSISV